MEIRDKDSLRRVVHLTMLASIGTYQVLNEDAMVFVYGSVTTTIYMPKVVDAAGLMFSIRMAAGTSNVTISKHASDGSNIFHVAGTQGDSQVLDAANEYIVLYSDGVMWYEVIGSHA